MSPPLSTARWLGPLALLAAGLPRPACADEPLRVAVTLSDIVPIVEAVGGDAITCRAIIPAGSDPHGVAITADDLQDLRRAALIVCANTDLLHFEEHIREALPGTPSLDWPDYVRHGAKLRDFPGFPSNVHGFWLGLENARAIARAIAAKLSEVGVPPEGVAGNLRAFERELDAAEHTGTELAAARGTEGRAFVAAIPGVAYTVSNLGDEVGSVLLSEGSSAVGGRELRDLIEELRTGEYAGVVCPLSMREAKAGEVSRQLAADAGAPVYYVRFLHPSSGPSSYLAQFYYNAAVLTGGGTRAAGVAKGGPSWPSLWGALVVAAVLAFLVGNRLCRLRAAPPPGAGIFAPSEGTDPDEHTAGR
jgi:zinc/manganese transport system substrate-binding protein